jgi:ParB family chromosome partitioning protein
MFGTRVAINKGKDRGKIEIEFYTEEDLTRILDVLGAGQ